MMVNGITCPFQTVEKRRYRFRFLNGCQSRGAGVYDEGSTVTVVAAPNSGFRFVNWTENGTPVSTSASYSFTVSAERTLAAHFAAVGAAATFDFDSGSPTLVTGQVVPFDQTPGTISAHFSGLGGDGFLVQTDESTATLLSQFSDHYLTPDSFSPGSLVISFDRPLSSIALTFATADYEPASASPAASPKASTLAAEGEASPLVTTPNATLTGLSNPWALAFDASSNLYVTDFSTNTVRKFAPGSTTPSATLSGLAQPRGVAFGSSGNLYVANYHGNTISTFEPGATTASETITGLSGPSALAFDAGGSLFVANFVGSTVSKFSPSGPDPVPTVTWTGQPADLVHDLQISWPVVPLGTPQLTSITLAGVDLTPYAISLSPTSVVVPTLAFPATASLPLTIGLTTVGYPSETSTQLDVTVDVANSPNPWRNYPLLMDANGDQTATPLDVLVIVNHLNTHGAGELPAAILSPPVYLDIDGNGAATPLDALILINHFNSRPSGVGEGEAMPTISNQLLSSAGQPVWDPPVGTVRVWNHLPGPLSANAATGDAPLGPGNVDDVLPDIALDVLRGWGQAAGLV